MGRAPCCDKANVKRGPWSPEEDAKLKEYIEKNGTGGNWISLPQKAGLKRCGKSCRLRWLNYLRPNIKHGEFTDDEDRIICSLFANIGSRWSIIAAQLPGRTDNDIKNYWNTKLKKKLMAMVAANQLTYHQPSSTFSSPSSSSSSLSYNPNNTNPTYYIPAPPATSLTPGLEPISYSSSTLLNSLHPVQETISFNYQVNESVVMVGGDQASACSSSDGSCSNKMISHGVEQQTYNLYNNGVVEDEEQRNGLWSSSEAALDYGLEEIKELISSNNKTNNNNHDSYSSILFEESMTEEKVVYYYY